MRYVESVDARAVVPSAGPPCFLDPDLFELNVISGDEPSIFVDQRVFLDRLAGSGHLGILAVPGHHHRRAPRRDHRRRTRCDDAAVEAIFTRQGGRTSRRYQADWLPWIDEHEGGVAGPHRHRPRRHAARVVGAPAGDGADGARADRRRRACCASATSTCIIDFPAGEVRPYDGEPYRYRFEIERPLVETVVAERAVDWSNSLFLSCRFRAWRDGEFNEWVYNFFKSLSRERMRRTEAEAIAPAAPADGGRTRHRARRLDRPAALPAPQRRPGGVRRDRGRTLTCTLHGWRFDLETGALPHRRRPPDPRAAASAS